MRKKTDLTGKSFGYLKVIKDSGRRDSSGNVYWICQCQCENKTILEVRANSLLSGHTKSCGCYNRQMHSDLLKKHNLTNHPLYTVHSNMKSRCYNPKATNYHRYGGRGISVCDEWLDKDDGFVNFYNWSLNNGYKKGLEIDRINNDGNYEPNNCRWITKKENAYNKSNNKKYFYNGKEMFLKEISAETNINLSTLRVRLHKGFSIEEAIKLPVKTNDKSKNS